MNQALIDRWRLRLAEMRGRLGNIKPDEIISFAETLGRKQRPGSSPPAYVSSVPNRPTLSVHYHPRAMKKGTARGALNVLEGDIDAWEMLLVEGKVENNGND